MTITELKENINAGKPMSMSEATVRQLFICLRDNVIKTCKFRDTLYEINFIPLRATCLSTIFFISDIRYPDIRSFWKLMDEIKQKIDNGDRVEVIFDNHAYEVILEALETDG